jgi:hypothetical protein
MLYLTPLSRYNAVLLLVGVSIVMSVPVMKYLRINQALRFLRSKDFAGILHI